MLPGSFVLCVLLVVLGQCLCFQNETTSSKIQATCGMRQINGAGFSATRRSPDDTLFGEFPWVVAILANYGLPPTSNCQPTRYSKLLERKLPSWTGWQFSIVGTLINSRAVLTVAHSVTHLMRQKCNLRVRAGEYDFSTDQERYPHIEVDVLKVITHNNFSEVADYLTEGAAVTERSQAGRQCKPLESTSVNFKCYKQDSTLELPCNLPQDNNSRAKATCKDSYNSEPSPRDLVCIDGSWDYMPFCTLECGTIVAPQGVELVISGAEPGSNKTRFPWHVGLYDKTLSVTLLICGGSIVSPKLVVTAAHCMHRDIAGLSPASTFAVAAGKIYRRWNAPRDDEKHVQKIDVIIIEIPESYHGRLSSYTADIAVLILERSFVFSSFVWPVCIGFDYTENFNGQFGKVAGWGLTHEDGIASNALKTVSLPFVSFQECYENSPEGYRPRLTSDKICAGYTNITPICRGDAGSGFVLARSNGYQDRHYLYGIISTIPFNDNLTSCPASGYAGLTNPGKHQEWFQNIWSKYNTIN